MEYTVLVVDDEQDQRRALVQRVDWASAGFRVVGEADNGVEALDCLETLEPDLILTDIRMPMISGLELAAKVREIRPVTQMVILSGYDSFEYAQTALKHNIISYLLKPISSEELTEELFEIKRRMDERLNKIMEPNSSDNKNIIDKHLKTEFLLPLMLGNFENVEDENSLANRAVELGIINHSENTCFRVVISKFKGLTDREATKPKYVDFVNNIISSYLKCESFFAYGRVVTLLISEKSGFQNELEMPLKELVQSAKSMLGLKCTIGVSREISSLNDCSAAYLQAVTARRYTSDGAGEIRFIDDQEKNNSFQFDDVEKLMLKLEQLLKVGSKDDIRAFLNEIYENNTPENVDMIIIQIAATVYRILSTVSDKSEMISVLSSNPIFSRLTSYSSESAMKNELLTLCENAKEIVSNNQKHSSEIICDSVIDIIDKEYSNEDLSLTGVSERLAVSPNYLSALIKKIKGKNFITLVTERRMKAAHDLLSCSNMKILEVAEKCGYSDQHYFSYCFKKFYGDSPNKVRSAK